ncbi:MAG TPA: M50 family metallopeptidase [Chroococcales cyanobacterium]
MITDLQSTQVQTRKATNSWLFWTIMILSLVFFNAPLLAAVLQPINTFATMVHEMSHALVCLLTGGAVSGMTIVSDGNGHGGLTFCHGGNPLLYTPAGYLGTAVFGSLLVYVSQFPRVAKPILLLMGIAVALASVVLVGANVLNTGFQGVFSFFWAIVIGAFLIWVGVKWRPASANILLLFLAVQTALNSLTSLVQLLQVSLGLIPFASFSDASSMAELTGVPQQIWSLGWSVISVVMLFFAFRASYGRKHG